MSKFNLIILGILLLAILFVPFVPDDSMDHCASGQECEDSVGYVSVYKKYVK